MLCIQSVSGPRLRPAFWIRVSALSAFSPAKFNASDKSSIRPHGGSASSASGSCPAMCVSPEDVTITRLAPTARAGPFLNTSKTGNSPVLNGSIGSAITGQRSAIVESGVSFRYCPCKLDGIGCGEPLGVRPRESAQPHDAVRFRLTVQAYRDNRRFETPVNTVGRMSAGLYASWGARYNVHRAVRAGDDAVVDIDLEGDRERALC